MIYENEENMNIYLASLSPRREALLSATGIIFEKITPYGEELSFTFKSPRYYVERKAMQKLEGTLRYYPYLQGCVITADTIVVRKKKIIEKPKSEEDVIKTLRYLSGKWHSVYTAYAIFINKEGKKGTLLKSCRTNVKFKQLSTGEIKNYIMTKEPLDKAGSYAAQGYGAFMIERIEGSYTNVVGLPLSQLIEDLMKLKVIRVKKYEPY